MKIQSELAPDKGFADVTAPVVPVDVAPATEWNSFLYSLEFRLKPVPEKYESSVFVLSNELEASAVCDRLEGAPHSEKPRIHIGFSGLGNLDFISARKSDYGLIGDVNEDYAVLFSNVESLFAHEGFSGNRADFINPLASSIERCHIEGLSPSGDELRKRLSEKLSDSHSWLGSDDNFEHIANLFREKRIVFREMNLTDNLLFAEIKDALNTSGIILDTFYISNIVDHLPVQLSRNDDVEDLIRPFRQTLASMCVDPETILLDTVIDREGSGMPRLRAGWAAKRVADDSRYHY